MIIRINKIVAFILIGTIISTATPRDIFIKEANAVEITNSANQVTMGSSEDATIATAISLAQSAGESEQLSAMNSIVALNISGGTQKVTLSSSPIGNLSYKLTEDKAKDIKDLIIAKMNSSDGQALTQKLITLITDPSYAAYKSDALIVLGVLAQLKITAAKADAGDSAAETQLITEIQALASAIPMYQYTGVKSRGISSQGFTAGGLIGLMTTPSETYNASTRNANYSISDTVPVLDLSSGGTFNKAIDLSNSNIKIICDGVNINVIDSENNILYCVNNPVYNMYKTSSGGGASQDLDIISFPEEVTNLNGNTTNVALQSQGIEEASILSLSLSVKTSTGTSTKNYKYATTIDETEKEMIDNVIDGMNLSTITSSLLKSEIKANTFVMIPNINSDINDTINGITDKINNTIDGVTDTINDLSDALNDLTDSLNDKDDDVDKAWDKVFDRFDNDEGWGKRDGYIYYYDKDGVSLKGVQKIDGKTYYFNRIDGAMETGWQVVYGKRCYFDKEKGYELFNQWIQDNDDWYYLGEDGAVKKMEWVNDGGKYYYLKADGKMTRDWLKIEDYWYYFNKDGSMTTSTWKWSNGKWYYLRDDGKAADEWLDLGSKWYYFNDTSGEMQTGWFRANGNWYYSNENGEMQTGWVYSKDGWCYLDETTGIMKKNEWATVDGKTYYFNINGIMVTGTRYIEGTKYNFNSDGTLNS
jgi:glucan-binding YG repeat protein